MVNFETFGRSMQLLFRFVCSVRAHFCLHGYKPLNINLLMDSAYCIYISSAMYSQFRPLITVLNFFCNSILFAICISTFSRLCKNVYSDM
jgi:hypothetical protein